MEMSGKGNPQTNMGSKKYGVGLLDGHSEVRYE